MATYLRHVWHENELITAAKLNNLENQAGILAPQYSDTTSYSVDDIVTYNGVLYKCISSISSGEVWNSNHWREIHLTDDFKTFKNDVVKELGSKINKNELGLALASIDACFTEIDTVDRNIREILNEMINESKRIDMTKADKISLSSALTSIEACFSEIDIVNKNIQESLNEIINETKRIDTIKADENEIFSILTYINECNVKINDIYNNINLVENNINNINDCIAKVNNSLIAVAANTNEISQIEDLTKKLETKAEINEISYISNEIHLIENNIFNLFNQLMMKADFSELISIINKFNVIEKDINLLEIAKTNINNTASILTTLDQLSGDLSSQAFIVNSFYDRIRNVENGKISSPSQEGTEGQVLSLNSNGTTTWIDITNIDESEISSAVSEWLDEHPDATTTVADGSITLDKLSSEVQETLGQSIEAQDALVLNNAIGTVERSLSHENDEINRKLKFEEDYKWQLDQLASYYTSNDNNLLFLFFTDPHTLYYNPTKSFKNHDWLLLQELQQIRYIYENTSARFVMCGGDWLNEPKTFQQAMKLVARVPNLLKTEIGEKAYTIPGNHDINEHGVNTLENPRIILTEQQLARIWHDKDVGYFTLEGNNWKGYMFDSGRMHVYDMTEYRWEQIDWFANQLLNSDKAHSFGIIHIHHHYNESTMVLENLYDNITKIANAFNQHSSILLNNKIYDFSSINNKTFHFMLFGHHHTDKILEDENGNEIKLFDNNIPSISVTTSSSSLKLDACYVDWDNSIIHLVRFGGTPKVRNYNIIPLNGSQVT